MMIFKHGRLWYSLLRIVLLVAVSVVLFIYLTEYRISNTQPTVIQHKITKKHIPALPPKFAFRTNHNASGVSTGGLWAVLPQNTTDCVPRLDKANSTQYVSMTPHCFNYIINNPNVCTDAPELFLLIYVYSAPDSFELRSAIRKTWGNKTLFGGKTLRVIFPIGIKSDPQVQKSLLEENNQYGDIIQEDYLESYKNLSYKGLQVIKWIHKYCSHVKHVLKVDTDVVININLLIYLMRTEYNQKVPFLACRVYFSQVLRPGTWCWKWCIRPEEYKEAYYPRYCWGPAFFTSGQTFKAFYKSSLTTPIWWIDDVFTTGIIPKSIKGFHHLNINDYWVDDPNTVASKARTSPRMFLFGIVKNAASMIKTWNILRRKH